jgi:ribosome-associated toxin RatA of RatAB toxin-antitoxin module
MPDLDLRAVVAAPVELVYHVVADVERYPDFLPDVARVEREADVVAMTVKLGVLPVRLVSRARFDPPRSIDLEQLQGPFRRFHAMWTFEASGGATSIGYRADYALPLLGGALAGLMGGPARALLEAQVQRQIRAFEARVLELAARPDASAMS